MKLLSKITYGGARDTVVWKYPDTSVRPNTPLIVPFTHEAILVKDGQPLNTYKSGKHILNARPGGIFGAFMKSSGEEFAVYYINRSLSLPIKWGTRSQMDLFDPVLNIPVRMGANGEFGVKIDNPRKFLLKVVGDAVSVSADNIQDFFRDRMGAYIKNGLASAMASGKTSFYELPARLMEISAEISKALMPEFDNYGVVLESFVISGIAIPENTKAALEEAFMKKAKEKIDAGYDYKEKAEAVKLKEKEKPVKTPVKPIINAAPAEKAKCPVCGVETDGKFCPACGARIYAEGELNKSEEPAKEAVEIFDET